MWTVDYSYVTVKYWLRPKKIRKKNPCGGSRPISELSATCKFRTYLQKLFQKLFKNSFYTFLPFLNICFHINCKSIVNGKQSDPAVHFSAAGLSWCSHSLFVAMYTSKKTHQREIMQITWPYVACGIIISPSPVVTGAQKFNLAKYRLFAFPVETWEGSGHRLPDNHGGADLDANRHPAW